MWSKDSVGPSCNRAEPGGRKVGPRWARSWFALSGGRTHYQGGFNRMKKSGSYGVQRALVPVCCGLSLRERGLRWACSWLPRARLSSSWTLAGLLSVQVSISPLPCLLKREITQLQPRFTKSEFPGQGPWNLPFGNNRASLPKGSCPHDVVGELLL